MSTNLIPFTNDEFALDLIPDGDSFKVAAPGLARALGMRDAFRLLESIPDDEKGSTLACTPGGEQRIGVVTEAGFYRAIGQRQAARITDPEIRAKVQRFQSWVYGTVLPEIRKTGGYQSAPALTADAPDDVIVHKALQITYRKVQELEAANSEMRPKAAYFDEFVADEDLILFRTLANQLEIGEKALRETLLARKWIYRVTGRRWSNKKQAIVDVHQYRAYAEKKHLFRLVPCHDAPRVNGEVQQALKLTPAGAESVARAVKRWGSQPQLAVVPTGEETQS